METFLFWSAAISFFLFFAAMYEYITGRADGKDVFYVCCLSAVPGVNIIVLLFFLAFIFEQCMNWENNDEV